ITSAAVGSAALLAARSLRQRLIELAVSDPHSPLTAHTPDAIVLDDGQLRSRDATAVDNVGEVLTRRMLNTLDSFSAWDQASGVGLTPGKVSQVIRSETSSWSFGAWFVKLTVDPDFGLVRVRH